MRFQPPDSWRVPSGIGREPDAPGPLNSRWKPLSKLLATSDANRPGETLAFDLAMKRTRAKVAALLKQSRKSLKDIRRIRKKLRALRLHVEQTKKAAKRGKK